MAGPIQISASISRQTKELMERYAREHGVKRGFLVETALRHHLQALHELPADVIVPPQLLLTPAAAERVLERLDHPRSPTETMQKLFDDEME